MLGEAFYRKTEVSVKQSLNMELRGQIMNREKLIYGLGSAFKARFLALCCCCRRGAFALRQKQDLYSKALEKIDKELDIRHISRELRTLRFISNVMLTKS
jgi:hypothetical protein